MGGTSSPTRSERKKLNRPKLSPSTRLESEADQYYKGNKVDAVVEGVAGVALGCKHGSYYSDPSNLSFLECGGALFSFTCRKGAVLPDEADIVRSLINLSDYDDEVNENYVPFFDVDDPSDVARYTYIVQKCAYVIPDVGCDSFANPDFLSTVDYHKACQPTGTKVWTDVTEDRTFRITKTIIRYIFHVTVQFRVSQLSRSTLSDLESLIGIPIDRGVLLERNRRSKKRPKKLDGTAKAKSVLLYTDLDGGGGTLVTNMSVVLHRGIPGTVAHVMDNFGSRGVGEVCETASRARKYLKENCPKTQPQNVASSCRDVGGKEQGEKECAVNGSDGTGPDAADFSVDATHTDLSSSFDGDDE